MSLDSGKLHDLLQQHRPALRLLAGTICRSPDDAVQAAFIKLATLTPAPANPAAWLYQVVKNNSISQLRADSRRRNRELAAGMDSLERRGPLLERDGKSVLTKSNGRSQTNSDAVDGDQLSDALTQLKADTRQIVIARVWGGLSYDEIAIELGCSSSTAHRRYQNALDQLRNILGLNWLVENRP